nr:hypothetical protein [uncultured bacterium]
MRRQLAMKPISCLPPGGRPSVRMSSPSPRATASGVWRRLPYSHACRSRLQKRASEHALTSRTRRALRCGSVSSAIRLPPSRRRPTSSASAAGTAVARYGRRLVWRPVSRAGMVNSCCGAASSKAAYGSVTPSPQRSRGGAIAPLAISASRRFSSTAPTDSKVAWLEGPNTPGPACRSA